MIFLKNVFCFAESIAICFYCKPRTIIKSKLLSLCCVWLGAEAVLSEVPKLRFGFACSRFRLEGFFHPYVLQVVRVKTAVNVSDV